MIILSYIFHFKRTFSHFSPSHFRCFLVCVLFTYMNTYKSVHSSFSSLFYSSIICLFSFLFSLLLCSHEQMVWGWRWTGNRRPHVPHDHTCPAQAHSVLPPALLSPAFRPHSLCPSPSLSPDGCALSGQQQMVEWIRRRRPLTRDWVQRS